MLTITFQVPGYQSRDSYQAWLIKGNNYRLAEIFVPGYQWMDSFRSYAEQRGFTVRVR